jgi:cobalamin biosynthetic protein CobC
LFQYVRTPHAGVLHEHLARQGILTRLFSDPAALRFGLPATDADWQRLQQALSGYRLP